MTNVHKTFYKTFLHKPLFLDPRKTIFLIT